MNENGKFELNKSNLLAYSHGEYYTLGKMIGSFGYSIRKKNTGKKREKKTVQKGKKQHKN